VYQSPSPEPARPRPTTAAASRKRRFTLMFSLPALLVVTALLAGTAQAPVAQAVVTAQSFDLAPTERHRRVSKLVSNVIERSHYRQSPINDPVSALVLDRFLEQLDGARSYFLASDIAEFERFRYQLDDAVVSGQLEPVFTIFNRFQQRNQERLSHALELLKSEPDFTVEESFEFDRAKAPWAKSTAELNEIWRQRVKSDAVSLMLTEKTWPETRDILRKRYERVLKRTTEQVTSDDIFEAFMNTFAHVFDPHSSYFSPRNSEEYKIQMSLSYEGIGASLQLVDDYVTVLNVLPGGPAAVNGTLNANDRIIAVAEGRSGKWVDVIGWRLDDVVQIIRGKVGTTVRLQILPAGVAPGSPEKVLELVRNKVTLEAQAAQKEVRKVQRGERELSVGVINVPSFYQDFEARSAGAKDYRSTTRDVRKLIEELKQEHIGALIMDLRGNGGGHLNEATALSGLFIPNGPIVQLRETGGRVEVLDDPEPSIAWDGPLIVLVDRFSASASEIFAAAIQDYGRGLVVGQQTYGKGSVQNLYPLDRYALTLASDPGFGQLTVTIGKYYRVTGESTQHRGVQPDIMMPTAINVEDVGESTRESALPWDRIRPVDFGRETRLSQLVAALEQSHSQRVASDPDFRSLLGDLESFERVRAQKRLSLNLKTRIAEREQQEKERMARENARRAARGLAPLAKPADLSGAEPPDAVLAEAAQIAADLSGMESSYLSRLRSNPARGETGTP
jgi:carboxyl-terminal processing protease